MNGAIGGGSHGLARAATVFQDQGTAIEKSVALKFMRTSPQEMDMI